MRKSSHKIYQKYFKRSLDFAFALIALILLSPVLLVISLLVRFKLGNPILFKQLRPGLNGKVFTMYKFRTMTNDKDSIGNYLSDNARLNCFGKFLRSTSLDELPELVNIIKGDMSLVGPRPLLVQYLELYDEHQRRRHEVRPGLTGYAQTNGRNLLSWEEKFDLDVKYVDNISFLGDLSIMFSTIKKIIVKEGINSVLSETVEPFRGKNEL